AAAHAVARRGRAARARAGRGVPGAPPPGARDARPSPGGRAARGQPAARGRAVHAGRDLPRRPMTLALPALPGYTLAPPLPERAMAYVDGFLLPIPSENLTAYEGMARKAGQLWIEHGAREY